MELTKRGFDRTKPDLMGVPLYTTATRTFSMEVKAGQSYFTFMAGGKWFIKTSTQSVTIPDVSGTYYFYFDTNGVLQYGLHSDITEEIFTQCAICGLAYYNKTAGVFDGAVDEQHGIVNYGGMDSKAHMNMHLTRGFTWVRESGGDIVGLVDASDVYTSIEEGAHMDEDIINVTSGITDTPFYYRLGSDGEWTLTASDLKVGHIASGDTYCSWNEWDGSTWKLTESTTSTDYIIMSMVKFNFINYPYRKIIGQKTYPSRSEARAGLKNELTAIALEGLPSTEAEFQFAWIVKRNGTLEDDGAGNAYVDLRGVPINAFS